MYLSVPVGTPPEVPGSTTTTFPPSTQAPGGTPIRGNLLFPNWYWHPELADPGSSLFHAYEEKVCNKVRNDTLHNKEEITTVYFATLFQFLYPSIYPDVENRFRIKQIGGCHVLHSTS